MSNKGTILLVISYLTLHSSVALPADSPYKEGQLLVRFAPKPDAVQLTEDERNAILAAIAGGGGEQDTDQLAQRCRSDEQLDSQF